MKLICPSCDLKGTADESLLNTKIKCPECRTVFILDSAVIVDLPPAEMSPSGDSVTVNEVAECVSCGFRYSRGYLTLRDSGLYCRVCASAGLQAEAAS
jgi:predicted Zn-ribbon and HTH transcriptional regulator